MKKNRPIRQMIFPFFIPFMIYLVFYDRISIKPSEAGFWMIITMGMAIGVLITHLFIWIRERKNKGTE